MKKRRITRLLALLLSILLALQGAASAVEPAEPSANPEPPEQTAGAPDGEEGSDVPEPGEEVPELIVITANLTDGQVVNNPRQSLSVEATKGETVLDAAGITVSLNGDGVAAEDGVYPLKLQQGDNTVVITAASDEQTQTLTLGLRYEIAIPDGWAHDALQFCVDYGILKGDQNGDLKATANATRAELAAMLVRLFGAQKMDALDGFSDVPDTAWYHDEMAKAVAMGIFKGSGNKLNPANRITREEAFVVLARAFGVTSGSTDALSKAPDKDQVSTWAANSVAGMLETGLVHGYSDGSLKPKGYITRQELAQVLCNALDCITDDPDALTGSRCLYTGPASALEGRQINGDLIVSSPDTEDLTLNNLDVTGRLVLHLHEVEKATIGTSADPVSLCSPTNLTLTNPLKTVNCLREGAELTADADLVIVDGAATLHGGYDKAVFLSGESVVAYDAAITEADASCNITLNGTAEALHARNKCTAISGIGSIGTLYKYKNGLTVAPSVGKTVDRVDAGLEGVKITSGKAPEAWIDSPTVTVTGTVSGVNTTQVYGVPNGVRTCTVTYSYGGKVIKTDKNFRLTEGATLSCPVTPTQHNKTEDQTVSVTISYQGQSVTGQLKVRTMGKKTPLGQAKDIRTCYVGATVLRSASVYAYSSLSGYVTSVSAGDIVHYFKSNGSASLIETSNGTRGWIADSAIRVAWRTYHNDNVYYSQEAKEAFVNQLHDYSSSTNYLVWVNLYSTTVNIFQGSKGNWKLIKTGECTIGAPNTPTRPGVYSIYSKTHHWSFDDYSIGRTDVSRCNYVSLFDGGIAFHTRLYYSGTSTFYGNSSLSAELSHGCVRCPDEIAIFIYNNCPIGTRVVVY